VKTRSFAASTLPRKGTRKKPVTVIQHADEAGNDTRQDESFVRDSYAATAFAEIVDRSMHAATARFTAGLSPIAFADAYLDWASHLAFLPGKRAQLVEKAVKKIVRFGNYAAQRAAGIEPGPCILPLRQDHRFDDPRWQEPPFNLIYQSFLLTQQWWHNAMTGVRGVTKQHENMVAFATRQFLDVWSPSNFISTNPEAMQATLKESGMNLLRGAHNMLEDVERAAGGKKPVGVDAFEPGRNVAITPGKVVYRNRLIELIQYAPATAQVRPEPILVVPAWIMKYYILDLSPANSLVKYLVGQGFTVFMISWKNPGPEDRDIAFDDYRTLGVMAALDAISAIVPNRKVHATGYCLGGTLLAIAAAAMARDGDERLASLSFFAAQMDFTEAGELTLFINESQLAFLEDTMWEQGFLDSRQLAGAFQLLRSNDLIWSRIIREYLLGNRATVTDLTAWNADATRMPYRMHAEYLRHLFLDNDLAEGRFVAGGRPVALTDIRVPTLAVGTETDHIAPWRSVFKLHLLMDTEVTFILTNGGHNAGVVSEPGHRGRQYHVATRAPDGRYVDPDGWIADAVRKDGSWWPNWVAWVSARSGALVAPPPLGAVSDSRYAPIADAPGTYVRLQ
jgi:polyhydroxyalkanoate synthase